MEKIFDTTKPKGFHTVTSYLMVENPEELITFLKNAFYAKEAMCFINPKTNEIANCILQIGDTCFMISQARDQYLNMRTSMYLYVNNVDEMHNRALANGAISEFEPQNTPYKDRQSGIIDPSGNYWWISERLTRDDYQE